ncbi:MFS family permease [Sphingobium sp. JAI105]|uniref:MFS transporter n=1 Tax=Sphingobium sp. JAI105 TaxID=2787715 RepID=UPI0018CB553E|nr:MFS transporter [Sphingobium sp. JAI105]MBG6118502.1 MFS family permease [Sphingobium sp. JAI105]
MGELADPRKRRIVLVSILLANFMVAMEATIVATAMPHIVGEIGGFACYTWVFSGYLLAQCTMTLIFGGLADIFGRNPIMILGIAVFLAGSLLAGFSTSMLWLIAFRLLQGIGAGAIQPMVITMIGDLYTVSERGRIQAIVATVWAGAAVIGPLTGAFIVAHLSWGWIFWINLPIGLVTIAGLAGYLKVEVSPKSARIDYGGAVTFAIANVSLLVLLTGTGIGTATWIALAAICITSAILFIAFEMRAADPMISIALWGRPLIAASNAASFLAGIAFIGVTTVMPLYVQGVMGHTAVVAGFTLTTLLVGWTLSMSFCNWLYAALGVRGALRLGGMALPLGAALLLLLTPHSSPVFASLGSLGMGMGMGLISITSIVQVQESVEWSMRGSATSSIIFSRSLGNALGATVMGAVLNVGIAHFGRGGQAEALKHLLNTPEGLAHLYDKPVLVPVFDAALHWSFGGMLVIAFLTLAAAWLMPIASGEQTSRTAD